MNCPRPRSRNNERRYPFVVQIAVPEYGFKYVVDAINSWHRYHEVQQRVGQRQCLDGQEFCRWCFEDAKSAELFRQQFGGELRLLVKSRDRPLTAA